MGRTNPAAMPTKFIGGAVVAERARNDAMEPPSGTVSSS
jgi:hypothetical protein